MNLIKTGFPPEFSFDSKLLILGSFPSVKSRLNEFYYGNERNRFWHVLCECFNETLCKSIDDKKLFLKRNKIALWDIVTECEIEGSKDSAIKNYKTANLLKVLDKAPIEFIILNGGVSYKIFFKRYADINIPYKKLPSTSPANVKFNKEEWLNAVHSVFK